MADAVRVEVEGLRDLLGRFARVGEDQVQQRQDQLLTAIAKEGKERLCAHAPRGQGPAPHLADMFQVDPLQRDGPNATIAISNEKTVQSKAGQQYNLLRLLVTGTAPHDIYGNPLLHFMIDGQDIWTTRVNHPGAPPRDFVSPVVHDLQVHSRLMQMARGVVVDLAG